MLYKNYILLILSIWIVCVLGEDNEDDCELHAPNTMHHFCCDIHDENIEFLDCSYEWNDKIHCTTDEEEMANNFCVSECVYNKTRYVGKDRQSLRMNLIKRHLSELHGDKESEELMLKTYEMCSKHAKAMLGHAAVKKLATRLAAYNCHPYPGLVFECVSNELILSCPSKMYHGSAQCDEAREYLKVCAKHRAH